MKKVVALAIFVLIAAGAFAQDAAFGSGQWLENMREGAQRIRSGTNNIVDYVNASIFRGFVGGIVQTGTLEDWFAIPDGVKSAQNEAVVGQFLEAHPELWNGPAAAIVIAAIYKVWPGKKNPGS
jgi:hypothetical protein